MKLNKANEEDMRCGYEFSIDSLNEIQKSLDGYDLDIDEIEEVLGILDKNNNLILSKNEPEKISCIIADKFPEYFDMEGENYDVLHRLEELGKELANRTDT